MQIDFRLFERCSLVLLMAVLVGVSGCRKFPVESEETSEPNPDDPTVAVNTRFLLNHGDFVRLGDTGLNLQFVKVLEDNRCPRQSICGRVGRAGIRLVVTEAGARDSEIVMYIPGAVEMPYEENGAVYFRGRYFAFWRSNRIRSPTRPFRTPPTAHSCESNSPSDGFRRRGRGSSTAGARVRLSRHLPS